MSTIDALAKLRAPFTGRQISKLPKETKAQIDERKSDRGAGIKCDTCGGWHHRNAVHLDYVGHAALTDRLLDTDPTWAWEPAALTPEGLPAFDRTGGLWIKLTVCGVTRLGYGAADGKSGGDAVKEIIGDALRNAAMRFGAALDLWHKGDLHADEDAADAPQQRAAPRHDPAPTPSPARQPEKRNDQAAAQAHGFAADLIAESTKMTLTDSGKFDGIVESRKYKSGMERLEREHSDLHAKVITARDEAIKRFDDVPY